MAMLKMFFPLIAFMLGLCNRYLQQNVPILYYADSNYLFVLNSENKLTKYNIDTDTSIFVKQIDSTIKTPLHLIAIDSSNFVLFYSSGANYTFISLENEQTYKNNILTHMSKAVKYKGGFVLNTISGIYICDNRMNIIGKIPCYQYNTCDNQIKILSNNYIILKEYDNLKDISILRVFDTLYNLINEIEIEGFISDLSELKIVENDDKYLLTFYISVSGNILIGNWNYKTSHFETQYIGLNNYTPLKIDRQFVYLFSLLSGKN
jgi:hypothetical protein